MSTGRKSLIGLSLIVFLVLGFMVSGNPEGVLLDQLIMDLVHGNNNILVIRIMEVISFLGSEVFLFPVMGTAIAYFTIKKRYYIATLLLVSSLGSFIVNHILKQIFQRPRPFEYFLVEQGGLSYPSGHSMVSMTMLLTIAYLLIRKTVDKKQKSRIWTAALIYIFLMGVSRVFLGVHWPSDIIGGYAAGYVFFEAYIPFVNKKLLKRDSA
ncbi:phosphatase PAP2 family protein [Gudongella sp. DL1XJH-153]|uniref:phosphatase PAP2 family protein n=1 Tax=Gudongella sp. DL1XJH-153 TaxID=3409804 RepID=UPI003BB6C233